jgi:hypothetical protein
VSGAERALIEESRVASGQTIGPILGRGCSRERVEHELKFSNSYTRIHWVMAMRKYLSRVEWFTLLGREWDGCDNIFRHKGRLRRALKAKAACLPAMMKIRERGALAAMPERFTVYRGCYLYNSDGLSWTLYRETAERFPSMLRYRGPPGWQAYVAEGTVSRSDVALKLERGEREIIAHTVIGITLEPISVIPHEQLFAAPASTEAA